MNMNKNRVRTRLSDSHLRDILRIKTTVFEPDLPRLLHHPSQISITLRINANMLFVDSVE